MAITFVGASSSSNTVYYVGTALPTGTQNGDFVLMFVRSWGYPILDMGVGQVPTDGVVGGIWTPLLANTARGGNHNLYAFCGVAEIGGSALPQVYFTGNGNHQMTILTFRGVDTASPVAASAKAVDTATAAHATPLVSAPGGSLMVRACATDTIGAAGSFTWQTGATERTDHRSSAGYAYLSTATSDNAGSVSATFTTAAAGMMATVALKPLLVRRLMLGLTPVPLMLGSTEVEIKGP